MNGLMGWELTTQQWTDICTRATLLGRVFNMNEGFTREDDTIAEKNFDHALEWGPPGSPYVGFKVDRDLFRENITTLYTQYGWDPESGIPLDATMRNFQLDDCIPYVQAVRDRLGVTAR